MGLLMMVHFSLLSLDMRVKTKDWQVGLRGSGANDPITCAPWPARQRAQVVELASTQALAELKRQKDDCKSLYKTLTPSQEKRPWLPTQQFCELFA